MHRWTLLVAAAALLLTAALSCSGGGIDPAAPSTDPGLSNRTHSGLSQTHLWGYYDVYIDIETQTVEAIMDRNAMFAANVVTFLNKKPGGLGFHVNGTPAGTGYVDVDIDVSITHPFAGLPAYNGYDVRGIFMGDGSKIMGYNSDLKYAALGTDQYMFSPDGYTRWFNHPEFAIKGILGYTEGNASAKKYDSNATLNPYMYFADGLGIDSSHENMPLWPFLNSTNGRGVFASGSTNTRNYLLRFPTAKGIKYEYAIVANWQSETVHPANAPEAAGVNVAVTPSLFWSPTSNGGNLILDIDAFGWEYQPSSIIIESTVLSAPYTLTPAEMTPTGGTDRYSTYEVDIPANNITSNEGQEFWAILQYDGFDYQNPFGVPNLAGTDALAAFFRYDLEIASESPKSITVTSPNGDENLVVGGTWNITWNWTGDIANVKIDYDTNNGTGGYPNTIVASTPCDGSFTWNPIPNTPSENCLLRITQVGGTVSDKSNAVFQIRQPGWYPIDGSIGIVVDPKPNQSTATPDLGIQNDGKGNEGAWMIDQGAGMRFFDYTLDWSAPGGNAYQSKFNYNFAPMGHFDAAANGLALFGCSTNKSSINPPMYNDPRTSIWYISYLLNDQGALAEELYLLGWGDSGNPTDPDLRPWLHTMDVSGGLPGWQGDRMQDSIQWLMVRSVNPLAPPVPVERSGDLINGFWLYYPSPGGGYLGSPTAYRWGMGGYTTLNLPAPPFEAFDVSNPDAVRLAADTDSYLTFGDPYDDLAIFLYGLDSLGNWYAMPYQVDWDAGQIGYLPILSAPKMRPEYTDGLYVSGAKAVDLEMLPTTTYLYEEDWELGFNWNAVLYDMKNGTWVVRIYHIDWTSSTDLITIVDTTDPLPGIPLSLDVDAKNFTIHVIANKGGNIEATVFEYLY